MEILDDVRRCYREDDRRLCHPNHAGSACGTALVSAAASSLVLARGNLHPTLVSY
jgi:hypothetical protein